MKRRREKKRVSCSTRTNNLDIPRSGVGGRKFGQVREREGNRGKREGISFMRKEKESERESWYVKNERIFREVSCTMMKRKISHT